MAAGANMEMWESCMGSRKFKEKIESDRNLGFKMGVEGTPTVFVGKQKIVGAVPYRVFAQAVRQQVAP